MKQFSLDKYLKNPNQKVVTRDGRNVKIHCTNYYSNQPIIAEVEGVDYSISFYLNGRFLSTEESMNDLFFATEKREVWINVFEDTIGSSRVESRIFKSKEDAEKAAKNYSVYITTIKMDWEE